MPRWRSGSHRRSSDQALICYALNRLDLVPLGADLVPLGADLAPLGTTLRVRYLYATLSGPASGEHALRHILQPMVWSPDHWEDRLHLVPVPLSMIYSRTDKLDYREGIRMTERLLKAGRKLSTRTWLPEDVSSCSRVHSLPVQLGHPRESPADLRVFLLPSGGHFPFINLPEQFHRALG